MRALVWKEINKVELIENVVKPELKQGYIRIKVKYTCFCGSDMTIVHGRHPRAKAPLILGHEFMGSIDYLPDDYKGDLIIGQRVTVEPLIACGECKDCKNGNNHVCGALKLIGVETDGGFAEYVNAPIDKVFALPDNVSDKEAALIEPAAVAVHSVDYGRITTDENVLVMGAGAIGVLIAQVARLQTKNLYIADVVPERLQFAKSLGLNVIDSGKADYREQLMKITEDKGFDVVFDAAGAPPVAETFIDITAIKGRIVITALYKEPASMLLSQLSYKEQSIFGVRIYAKGDFEKTIALVRDKKIDIEPLVTRIFDMNDAVAAYEYAEKGGAVFKVLIKQ